MSAQPPRLAARLLARLLTGDVAGHAILGDLLEDFHEVARTRGSTAARRWYWREAVPLALRRLLPSPFPSRPETMRNLMLPGGLLRDAADAFRTLRRNPGFALFTAAVIGLGVGAATAVFSVLKPLVLAPLPFVHAEELVWIANVAELGDNSITAVTSRSANLYDFRERSRSFDGLTGYNAFFDHTAYALTGAGEPERLVGADVAHDFLDVLGVEPLHGRSFFAEEGRWGGPAAVILSHGLWRRRFAADPTIVGETLNLNGRPRTVVGVLPPTFDFSSVFSPGVHVDFLLPFPVIDADDGGFQGNTLVILGRLKPGVSSEAAQADLDAILAALEQEQPNRWGLGAEVTPLQARIAGPFRGALLLLAAAAGTLLLIVCVNVSNLILARSPARAREVALRQALGGSNGRLARQLLLETLEISLAGAAFGSGLAWGATQLIATSSALQRIPLLAAVQVDAAALLFAAAIAVLTGLLVGLVPVLQVAGGRAAAVLRDGGRGATASRGAQRLRETLVIAEVALACVLLVVGGLLVRSFRAVLDVDLGFDPGNVVAWQLIDSVRFEAARESEALRERRTFYAELAERVAAIPGIEAVGLTDALPLGRNRSWTLRVVDRPDEEETQPGIGFFPHIVDPGYLRGMRIPLLEGRNISPDDTEQTAPVVLMNETGARRVFGGDDALGQRFRTWGPWEWEVVGIVRDVRHLSPEMDPGVEVYFPVAQMPDFHTLDLIVRSRLPAAQIVAAVRAALRQVDPAMPTGEFWTLRSTVDRALSARSFTVTVLTAFGAVALLLAAIGIYGVLAYSVAERTTEIGIRMALGASAADIVRGVLGRTLLLAGAGSLAGAALSLPSARLVGSLLYGVSATDPATFVAGGLVLLAVAAAAGAIPATRAVRIEVIGALKGE